MTVSVQTPLKAHTANGVTTSFPYDFLVLEASTLKVYVNGALTSSGFSVSGVGNQAGGSVTFSTAPASGARILLVRLSPLSRATDFTDDLLVDSLNRDADRVWLALQEFATGALESASTLRVPNGEQIPELPIASERAGKLAGFDSTGSPTVFEVDTADSVIWTTFGSEQQVATANQALFTLQSSSYVVGTNSLRVFIDGIRQNIGADYTETNASQVTFASGLSAGQRVTFDTGRYVSTGLPLASVGKGMAEDAAGGAADSASYRFRRRAPYSGGTPGFVNAALFVDTFVEASPGAASSATAFEWTGCFVMHNRAAAGENVALYRQGIKYPGAGPTWAGTDEIIDCQIDPASGATGVELSFTANGTDANSARVAYDVALRKRDSGGASPVAAWGYRIQTEAGSKFVRGFAFTSGSTADVGFDTSLGVMNTAAFKMAQGQAISFNATDSRKLFHNGSSFLFTNGANASYWSLNDDGSLVNGTLQVLGTRRTGWVAATGTATRTAFATGSVTLPQLAERVKALIDDLTTHGLIGA